MMVEMEKNGTLVLYPETELESYALMKWLCDFERKSVTIRVANLSEAAALSASLTL